MCVSVGPYAEIGWVARRKSTQVAEGPVLGCRHVAALLVWDSGPVWVGVPYVALTVHSEPDYGPARVDRAGLS